MGLHRRELALTSVARRLRGPAGIPGTAPVPATGDPHAILTVTDDGGIALFTTAAPHGLTGEHITITGCSDPAYNVVDQEVGLASPTTFYANTVYVGDATGGTWALA